MYFFGTVSTKNRMLCMFAKYYGGKRSIHGNVVKWRVVKYIFWKVAKISNTIDLYLFFLMVTRKSYCYCIFHCREMTSSN